MSEFTWAGVMPAITTPFTDNDAVDHAFLAEHANWLVEHGGRAIIPFGSLGEGATLEHDERAAMLETLVGAVGDRVPVIPAISALSTRTAVMLAEMAVDKGCKGLMVLPPYVHKGDWRENRAHFAAVFQATELPCMLYNNPIAYGVDVLPEQMVELASEFDNLVAMKDSGGDHRRITANHALLGDRIALFAGLDDMPVEAVSAGAVGWVAGLVNALPAESVELFRRAVEGEWESAYELYHWHLPLLRLDCVPEFVQLIKLVQHEVGMGSERVRPPRLTIQGAERERVIALVRDSLATNPLNS
jgi:4-hydroxy-tetrahydrodipicolinate synthase